MQIAYVALANKIIKSIITTYNNSECNWKFEKVHNNVIVTIGRLAEHAHRYVFGQQSTFYIIRLCDDDGDDVCMYACVFVTSTRPSVTPPHLILLSLLCSQSNCISESLNNRNAIESTLLRLQVTEQRPKAHKIEENWQNDKRKIAAAHHFALQLNRRNA